MWGTKIGSTWDDSKLHFFINNQSVCGKAKLSKNDYIKYQQEPKKDVCCNSCLILLTPKI